MDADTLTTDTFKLLKQGRPVNYDPASKTATLDPNRSLSRGETYRVTVLADVKDAQGITLAEGKIWSFKVK